MNLLEIIFFYPILCILFLILCINLSNDMIHKSALIFSAISFILSIILFFALNFSIASFQFKFTLPLLPTHNTNLLFGVDGISIFFIILTNFIIYLCILSLPTTQKKLLEFIIYLFLIQWTVLGAFCVLDLIGFYILFETTLIPIFFIVLVWGSRSRKVRASYLICIYTIFGSVLMLFAILYLLTKIGSTNYLFLNSIIFTKEEQYILWLCFFISFATKLPMFPLHIWLPEAHVEAPTVGSVLLAVLLLKLGGYGLIRFSFLLFPQGTILFTPIINSFAMAGIIYTSLIAIRLIDIKKIIAYSSIGHMNTVLLGLTSLTAEGIEGSIFQMLSHGIISGGLFFCIGSLYLRNKIRSLKYFGGLMITAPLIAIIFLIFSLANISFPGTSSFVGESVIFLGLFLVNTIAAFFSSINMILGAIYSLWSYNRIAFGNDKDMTVQFKADIGRIEFLTFFILIIMLFSIGLYPNIIFKVLHICVNNFIEQTALVCLLPF